MKGKKKNPLFVSLGRQGGRATFKKYGPGHFRALGKRKRKTRAAK